MQALKPHNRIPHKHRFTLVELMVVLIIVGIMLAALAPAFNRLMTGNAVGAAERMISSQLSLARAEAARRRCKVAIVVDDHDPDSLSNSLRAAYEDQSGVWQWLPGSRQDFLPTGALIGHLTTASTNVTSANYSTLQYPLLDYTVSPAAKADTPTISINGDDAQTFPAVVFMKNGRAENTCYISIIEAIVPAGATTPQFLNANYCQVLTVSQYTGKVSIEQVNKP